MLFRLHFLLYCIFVSYNQFLFFFLHFTLCRMCVCHMFNKVLTYLLTYLRECLKLRDIDMSRSCGDKAFQVAGLAVESGRGPIRDRPVITGLLL